MDDVDGMVDRYDVRKKLDRNLDRAKAALDPKSWGTSDEARQGMQRMMALTEKMDD